MEFAIPKEILISRCPFFEKCLNAQMKEAEENAVSLPEEEPQVFRAVVYWLYGTSVFSCTSVQHLVKLYNLADKFDMPELQNTIATRIQAMRNLPAMGKAAWAWAILPEACPRGPCSRMCSISGWCSLVITILLTTTKK